MTRVEHIGRATLYLGDAADDLVSIFARDFFARLTCEKRYLRFTSEDGAGDHCVMGRRLSAP